MIKKYKQNIDGVEFDVYKNVDVNNNTILSYYNTTNNESFGVINSKVYYRTYQKIINNIKYSITEYYSPSGNITEKNYYLFNANLDEDCLESLHNKSGPAKIFYYENGNIKCEEYWAHNRLHNIKGPAIIKYYNDGKIESKTYFVNDKVHNKRGPAQIYYNENGKIKRKYYYINNDWLKDVSTNKELKQYKKYKKIINNVQYNIEEYYKEANGIWRCWCKRYWIKHQHRWNHEVLHNEFGPAEIYYYENGNIKSEAYFINGELHNKNGPAKVTYNKNGNIKSKIYYLEGTEFESFKDWQNSLKFKNF